jgi:hypothetical protein
MLCIQFMYEFFMQMQSTMKYKQAGARKSFMYFQVLCRQRKPDEQMKLLNHLITHLQFLPCIPLENQAWLDKGVNYHFW